jgi:hypothetical protein
MPYPFTCSGAKGLGSRLGALAGLTLLSGCAGQFHPATPTRPSAVGLPLPASTILVPLPNDDASLLGRVLFDVPENGLSLDDVWRPNECADKLSPSQGSRLATSFETAQELADGDKAKAPLVAFGFKDDVHTATHFYYKLDVSKRVSRSDTADYAACCQAKGSCGYGFVSAILYGDGEYATADEASAQGNVLPVAGAAGPFVRAKLLHERRVHGYVAAVITVTAGAKPKSVSVLGDPAAAGGTKEETLSDSLRHRYEDAKIAIDDTSTPSGTPGQSSPTWQFRDGRGFLTENEFVRRFATLTGSRELADADRNRGGSLLLWSSLGLVASAGLVTAGLLTITSPCSAPPRNTGTFVDYGNDGYCPAYVGNPAQSGATTGTPTPLPPGTSGAYDYDSSARNVNVGSAVATGIGGVGLIVSTGLFVWALNSKEGTPTDHSLRESDAQFYVTLYNRALLKKIASESWITTEHVSSRAIPRVTLVPVLAPGFVGLTGTF